MPRSRHHRKRRAGTKKRGRRGGNPRPTLSPFPPHPTQVSAVHQRKVSPVPPHPTQVSPVHQKKVSPVPPHPTPVSPVPQKKVSLPSREGSSSFKDTMQGHMTNAKGVVSGALSGLSNLMSKASSGGRKSRRRRTHKRRSRVRKVRRHKTYKKRKHKRRRH